MDLRLITRNLSRTRCAAGPQLEKNYGFSRVWRELSSHGYEDIQKREAPPTVNNTVIFRLETTQTKESVINPSRDALDAKNDDS